MKAGRRLLPLLALGMFLMSAPSINGKVRPAAYPANGRLELTEVADLGGDTLLLPPETTIQLRGGYFRNGTVVGHKTSIRGQGPAFDHIRIAGTWHVPVVRTSLLVDASYENALRDIMALTSPAIRNKVIIEKGEYRMTALKEKDTCVPIGSNTEVIVEGTIRLTPNPYQHYNILCTEGENRCDLQQLTPDSEPVVWCRGVQNLTLRGNTLRYDAQPSDTIPLHLIDCGEKDVRKNRLIPKS